jgi:hypothetical protein
MDIIDIMKTTDKLEKEENWFLRYVSKDTLSGEYIIWDRSEGFEIGRTKTKEEAKDLCLKQAECI